MIRCITAHQLWEKYVVFPPGDVYQPTQGWWLLVTFLDYSTLVSPITLLICLENLRNFVEANVTLCFHLADIYRGKFPSQHWLQLIAITFCRQAKIHILDRLTYTPESPVTALEALSIVHDWSCIHMGDRPLRRTVWEVRRAVFEHLTPLPIDEHDNAAGKWPITLPKIKPNYTLDNVLQHRHHTTPRHNSTMLPGGLIVVSATARNVIREYGQENIFRLRPSVGTAIRSSTAPWNNQIFLLCTRASTKYPRIHETLHACLTHLSHQPATDMVRHTP